MSFVLVRKFNYHLKLPISFFAIKRYAAVGCSCSGSSNVFISYRIESKHRRHLILFILKNRPKHINTVIKVLSILCLRCHRSNFLYYDAFIYPKIVFVSWSPVCQSICLYVYN